MEMRDTTSLDQTATSQSAPAGDLNIDQQQQKAAFLTAYKEFGHDGAALATANISFEELEEWKKDESFNIRYEQAYELFSGSLVREAIIRARDGWDEPIIHHGEVQYLKDPDTGQLMLDDTLAPIPATVRKKSEGLLKLALKANIEQYNPQSKMEVTGPEGEPLTNNITVEFIQPGTAIEHKPDESLVLEHDAVPHVAVMEHQKLEVENHG